MSVWQRHCNRYLVCDSVTVYTKTVFSFIDSVWLLAWNCPALLKSEVPGHHRFQRRWRVLPGVSYQSYSLLCQGATNSHGILPHYFWLFFDEWKRNSYYCWCCCADVTGDCNPGLVFPISGFRIEDFVIPGSRRDYGILLRIWDLPL